MSSLLNNRPCKEMMTGVREEVDHDMTETESGEIVRVHFDPVEGS